MISRPSPEGRQRDLGASGRRALLEHHADRLVPDLLQSHREQVLYLVVGAWNTLAGYGAFAILYFLLGGRLSDAMIIIASYAVAIANAYVGYRYVAFRSHASIIHEFPRFSAVYVATLVVNLAFFPLALSALPVGAYVVQAVFTIGVVIASYLAHRHFSFRHPSSDAPTRGAAEAGGAARQATGLEGPTAGGE